MELVHAALTINTAQYVGDFAADLAASLAQHCRDASQCVCSSSSISCTSSDISSTTSSSMQDEDAAAPPPPTIGNVHQQHLVTGQASLDHGVGYRPSKLTSVSLCCAPE